MGKQQRDGMSSQFAAVGAAVKVFQAQSEMKVVDKKIQDLRTSAEAARSEVQDQADGQEASPSAKISPEDTAAALDEKIQAQAAEYMKEMAALQDAAGPLMLDAMWAANVIDIRGTLAQVCKCVLYEKTDVKSMQKASRAARAEALQELGRIYLKTSAPTSETEKKDRMEEAMKEVMERQAAGE